MKKIKFIIEEAKKIGITGHIRPDGDCVGSVMGLYNYITENYKDIQCDAYLEPVSPKFNYISKVNEINNTPEDEIYDLFISLDVSDTERMGPFAQMFKNAKRTYCFDHHISNTGIADENDIVPDASSTCEVLYESLDEDKISKSTAEAIYTGIIHDTGVFKYQSTSERTMLIAGKLMSKGIDFTSIIDESFYAKTYVQNQILGRALLESVRILDGKCIFTAITKEEMEFYNITSADMDGIVEQLRLTDGVECAVFMYEVEKLQFKVSLRSKSYINVSEIASYFGGGGHVRAAGCTLNGTVYDAVNNLSKFIEQQIEEQ